MGAASSSPRKNRQVPSAKKQGKEYTMIRLALRYARYALSALATIGSRSFYYREEVKPTSLKARPLGNSPLLRPIRSSGKRLLTSSFHGLKTLRRARKNLLIPLVVAIAGSLLVIGCGTPPIGTSPKPTGTIKE